MPELSIQAHLNEFEFRVTLRAFMWPCQELCAQSRQTKMHGYMEGQARGYGRITHFLPLPTWGSDFPWAIVTQSVGIFQTSGCHMKVFP